ncbi:MAG: hypothetical protein ACYDEN_11330 [Acidimicrobiales bacterium]
MSDTPSNLPVVATQAMEARLDRLPALDVEDVIERTLTRTLSATTAEEVLADPEARGLRDFVGRVITITGVAGALPSRYDTGLSRYLVVDVEDETTGTKGVVTVGSPFVAARVLRLVELGALPARVRVVELESASNPGQASLWITKP